MLEQEIAALIHFIEPLNLKIYTNEVPESFATPSAYFPAPEIAGNKFSLSTYENSFSLYIKIFDKDTPSSFSIATKIVNMVQSVGKKIQLYDENGELTGRVFRVKKLYAKSIDKGVTQIQIEWDRHMPYVVTEKYKSVDIHFSGLPIE